MMRQRGGGSLHRGVSWQVLAEGGRVQQTLARRPRVRLLYVLLVGFMGLLAVRSFQLQIVQGGTFRGQAEGNRVTALPQAAARGLLYDQYQVQLVDNIASTDLVFDPAFLPSEEHEAPLVDRLPQLVDSLEPDQVRGALTEARRRQRAITVTRALPHATVVTIEGMLDELPGVRLDSTSVRQYHDAYPLSSVMGYTGLVTAEEVAADEGLLPTDVTGKAGIERSWDAVLRGRHGARYVEVDAAGRMQRQVDEEAAIPGSHVHLTIDAELQKFIFDTLADRSVHVDEELGELPVKSGAVVALDPRSGAVRALVSFPSYDANTLAQPGRRGGVGAILEDPMRPLFNRAVSGTYPPGSTIKPLLAAAGLQEELIDSRTTIFSSGGISIGPWHFPDWRAGGHGSTDVTKAIADSVNTFFYLLAGGDETRTGLGVRRATDYLAAFSWGALTGVDLPAEAAGLLPSPEWKQEVKDERWYIGDTYHLGIGQGDVLATPLQVATATAVIANGGTVYTPHVVAWQQRPDGTVIEVTAQGREVEIDEQHLALVAKGMRRTVEEGSGRRLSSLPIAVSGKTGTAQVGGGDDTHAWFTSFGPGDVPELVVTVLLERGGAGDTDAVPVAQEIWQWWAEKRFESS